jgi:hypothetical protein
VWQYLPITFYIRNLWDFLGLEIVHFLLSPVFQWFPEKGPSPLVGPSPLLWETLHHSINRLSVPDRLGRQKVEIRWLSGEYRWQPIRKYVTSVSGDVLFLAEELQPSYLAIFVLLSENYSPTERNFPGCGFFPGNSQSPCRLPVTHRGCGSLTSVTNWYFILTYELSLRIYPVWI